jgi:hypothetical protein
VRPDRLAVVLAPLKVDLDQLAEGLGGGAPVASGHHLGLEPGFLALGLLAAALDLPADLALTAGQRIDARVDDDLPAMTPRVDRHA